MPAASIGKWAEMRLSGALPECFRGQGAAQRLGDELEGLFRAAVDADVTDSDRPLAAEIGLPRLSLLLSLAIEIVLV